MLKDKMAAPVVPAKDLERAKKFYAEKLGLEKQMDVAGGAMFSAGSGTGVFVYQKEDMTPSTATVVGFNVDNIEGEVEELRGKGVTFEEYDMPGLKTENGVATMDSAKAAWFKDSEGNIISLNQM